MPWDLEVKARCRTSQSEPAPCQASACDRDLPEQVAALAQADAAAQPYFSAPHSLSSRSHIRLLWDLRVAPSGTCTSSAFQDNLTWSLSCAHGLAVLWCQAYSTALTGLSGSSNRLTRTEERACYQFRSITIPGPADNSQPSTPFVRLSITPADSR